MSQRGKTFVLALVGFTWVLPAQAAEREQVRMVINLVAGVKMPFPQNLRNNVARTERVQLDTNGATASMISRGGVTSTLHLSVRAPRCCVCAASPLMGRWSAKSIITLMIMTSTARLTSAVPQSSKVNLMPPSGS